ncbi:MAG: hypothetical protein ABL308_14115 [Oceanicaulis sp.]
MSLLPLWVARLIVPLALLVHLVGIVSWHFGGRAGATQAATLTGAAWLILVVYTLVSWFAGDYIQKSLNLKPWVKSLDPMRLEAARIAMTRTCMTVLILIAILIGLFWNEFVSANAITADDMLFQARALMLGLSFVLLAGASLPTALMAWSLTPLTDDHDDV